MSLQNFIQQACELMQWQDQAYENDNPKTSYGWYGPLRFMEGACWNWALFGSMLQPPFSVDGVVRYLAGRNVKNTKRNRRIMVRGLLNEGMFLDDDSGGFIGGLGELHSDEVFGRSINGVLGSMENVGGELGKSGDPCLQAQNQVFIGTASPAGPQENIHWSHWWIEIHNIHGTGTPSDGRSLKLETVPAQALEIRRLHQSDKDEHSGEQGVTVSIPVTELTQQHYQTLAEIHRARTMLRDREFPGVKFAREAGYYYVGESGLWQRLLDNQPEAPRTITGITPAPGYYTPSIRQSDGHGLVTAGGSCTFSDGTVWQVQ